MSDGGTQAEPLLVRLSVRLSVSERAELDVLRGRLERLNSTPGVRVTDRVLVLTALDRLRQYLDALDRDRERRR